MKISACMYTEHEEYARTGAHIDMITSACMHAWLKKDATRIQGMHLFILLFHNAYVMTEQ